MSPALEGFIEYITIIKGLNPKTVSAYRRDLETIEESASGELLHLSASEIFGSLAALKNKRTLNRKLSAYNSFLDFCHKQEFFVAASKLTLSKIPKALPKHLSHRFIMESLERIDRSDWMGLRDYALLLFLYATGARISECLMLRREDIEGEWLRIRHGKGDKERYIPIAHEALTSLETYLRAAPFKNYKTLWVNYRGGSLSRISAFKITQKYLGTSPHTLRHSYATGLIVGGADVRVVQELLGHSSLLTTQIYTHIQRDHLRNTVIRHHPLSGRVDEIMRREVQG